MQPETDSIRSEVEDRIDRAVAQQDEMEFTVTHEGDPIVILVDHDAGSGDDPYAVVPDALHCSCPDNTYRGPFCKHQIALAMQDSDAGDQMTRALVDEHGTVEDNVEGLREHLAEAESRLDALSQVLEALDDPRVEDNPPAPEDNPWAEVFYETSGSDDDCEIESGKSDPGRRWATHETSGSDDWERRNPEYSESLYQSETASEIDSPPSEQVIDGNSVADELVDDHETDEFDEMMAELTDGDGA